MLEGNVLYLGFSYNHTSINFLPLIQVQVVRAADQAEMHKPHYPSPRALPEECQGVSKPVCAGAAPRSPPGWTCRKSHSREVKFSDLNEW